MSLLDVGTGSGILAIAASKLGAGKVFAYDIDPMAIKVAEENCLFNGCENVELGIADLLRGVNTDEKYDFVSANIVADILVRLAPDVARYMKDGGHIAVSGIIDSQEDRVKDALIKGGLTYIKTEEENDWNAMVFVKEGKG
jgi:ribosomal protein L11 methyltransferase